MRLDAAARILAALIVAALILIAVEALRGRAGDLPQIANPCATRPAPPASGDATVQRIVLAGLDRAACRLGTSREALVLAVAGSSAGGGTALTNGNVTTAVRAGLQGSLAEAVRRGDVPAFAAPLLERLIRSAPIDQLVRGGFSLSDLFG